MSKIKDCFSNIAKNYKHNVLQYTFTHIIVMITTAILVLGNYDKFDNILEQIAIIGLISAINAFASESFCKKTWQRVITGIIGTVIGIIFARLINMIIHIPTMTIMIFLIMALRYAVVMQIFSF